MFLTENACHLTRRNSRSQLFGRAKTGMEASAYRFVNARGLALAAKTERRARRLSPAPQKNNFRTLKVTTLPVGSSSGP